MNIPRLKSKDLLSITDLDRSEIVSLFACAARLKKFQKKGRRHNYLKGKTLGMLFEKSSTRTRVSFEAGMFQLGGYALFLSKNDIQLGRGETIVDTARVLSRYLDCIMCRTYEHETAELLSRHTGIPIINGLSDRYHPCQALTDFFTIYERENSFNRLKIAYVGDGNNVANSLMHTAAILGIDIALACPPGYLPTPHIVEESCSLAKLNGAQITVTSDIDQAVNNAHYLYTDVWVSMGQEQERETRLKAFDRYRITEAMLRQCAPDCKIMHCLPAHRGEEIEEAVIDSDRSIIFDQAENRLHLQKALLCALIR